MNDEQWKRIGKAMNQAVTPMLEKIFEDMRQVGNAYFASIQPQLTEAFNQIFQSLQPQLEKIAENFEVMLKTVEADAEIIAPLLEKSNLWITPSMPYSLIFKVKELANNKDTRVEAVEEVFLEYFEKMIWKCFKR